MRYRILETIAGRVHCQYIIYVHFAYLQIELAVSTE